MIIFKCLHGLVLLILLLENFFGARLIGDIVAPIKSSYWLPRKSFAVAGPSSWNVLQVDLRSSSCGLDTFAKHLKTQLCRESYPWQGTHFRVRITFCKMRQRDSDTTPGIIFNDNNNNNNLGWWHCHFDAYYKNWYSNTLRYRGRNAATAEEVSRYQCFFPNPNWLVRKGIPIPKTHFNTHGWITSWWLFSTSSPVRSCKASPEVWLSTLGQTSNPSLEWKKATFSK